MAAKKRKNPMGRPSKWNPAFTEQVRKLCLLGATIPEIADFFEVNPDTIHEWMKTHSDFSEAIKAGRAIADSNVANRLYQRAMGFEHDSEEIKTVGSRVVRVPVRKIYPPDTVAAIFWLKNRQKDKWRDKIEQDLTTNGESLNMSNLTPQELKTLLELRKKIGR